MAPLGAERHLNALPFSVLLENIAGLLAPRLQRATIATLPLRETGLSESSSFDVTRLDAAVRRHVPHSLILLPQMLRAWCAYLLHSGQRAPASLRFVAVGGAAVDAADASLPDHARIARWTRGRAAFDADTGLATPNGRPRRAAIHAAHADALGPSSLTTV